MVLIITYSYLRVYNTYKRHDYLEGVKSITIVIPKGLHYYVLNVKTRVSLYDISNAYVTFIDEIIFSFRIHNTYIINM